MFVFTSFILLTHLISVRPFNTKLLNYAEIFNETFVLLVGYHCIMFSGIISDSKSSYKMGYFAVLFAFFNILVNLIHVICETLSEFYERIRKYIEVKTYK